MTSETVAIGGCLRIYAQQYYAIVHLTPSNPHMGSRMSGHEGRHLKPAEIGHFPYTVYSSTYLKRKEIRNDIGISLERGSRWWTRSHPLLNGVRS